MKVVCVGPLRRVGVGLHGDLAAVHLDDPVCHGETEAGALAHLLGGEERAEELVEVLVGDAGAVVGDHDDDVLLGAVERDEHAPAVGQRVLGVGEQVGEHLHDLVGVELGHRVGEAVVDGDRDALVDGDGAQHLLDEGGKVGGLPHDAALTGEVEQPGDDLLAAVRLVDDQLDVLGHRRVVLAVLEQQIGVQQQDAEGVVDLVGDAGGELAHAGELLALDQGLFGGLERVVGLLQLVDRLAQLLDGVGQAHLDLREALPDGHGVVAAARRSRRRRSRARPRPRTCSCAPGSRAAPPGVGMSSKRWSKGAKVRERSTPANSATAASQAAWSKAARRGRVSRLTSERRLNTGSSQLKPAPMMQPSQQRMSSRRASVVAVLELGDGVGEVGAPVGGDDVAGQQVLVEVGGLQHAARDGEEGAQAAVRRRRSRRRSRAARPMLMPRALEQGAQLDERERGIDLALELLVLGLALLGDARADEGDLDVGAVLGVQHAGDGEHRRDDRAPAGRAGRDGTCACSSRRPGRWWRHSGRRPVSSRRAYSAATRSAPKPTSWT